MKDQELSLVPAHPPQDAPAPATAPPASVCPRCEYARRPTDTAPAWQCPRCEVAYNKAQAARRPVVDEDEDEDDGDGARHAPRARRSASAATARRGPSRLVAGLAATAIVLVALMAWKSGQDKARAAAARAAQQAAAQHAQAAQAAEAARQRNASTPGAQPSAHLVNLQNRWHFGEGQEVMPAVRSLAEEGDTRAMVILANMLHGRFHRDNHNKNPDIPKDHPQAMQWLHKAAERGDPVAAVRLGGIYERGEDEPVQPSLAENWYLRAARQGYAPGLYSLGYLYARGVEPVGKRPVAGYMLLELAANASRAQPGGEDLLPEQHDAASAVGVRDRLERDMSRDDVAEAQRRAQAWKPGQPLGV